MSESDLPPTRAVFIASDENLGESSEFQLKYSDNSTENLVLPLSYADESKYYYTCTWKLIVNAKLVSDINVSKLWMSLAGHDFTSNTHTSDWYELNADENIYEFVDLTSAIDTWKTTLTAFSAFGLASECVNSELSSDIAIGTILDKCKHYGIFNGIAIDSIGTQIKSELSLGTLNDAWNLINGKQIIEVDSKLGLSLPRPILYTSLKLKNPDLAQQELQQLNVFKISYIAIIESDVKPLATNDGDKIFASGRVNLKCHDCSDLSSYPKISLKMNNSDELYKFTARPYDPQNSCETAIKLSFDSNSNWYQAPVIFMADLSFAPMNASGIGELYFVDNFIDNQKLKLEEIKCESITPTPSY